jgi:hypothetical protein
VIRRLLARLFPPRGRHVAREPEEPHSHVCTRACDLKYGFNLYDEPCPDADSDPGAVTVLLPAVPDAQRGHQPAPVVPQPHEGATLDWSPAADFADSQPTGAGSVPETRAMRLEANRLLHEALSDVEARLRAGLDAWWPAWLARLGLNEGDVVAVHDFAEAITLAGAYALPAVPVDWTTAEWALVEVTA